jgi:hypothetical protein
MPIWPPQVGMALFWDKPLSVKKTKASINRKFLIIAQRYKFRLNVFDSYVNLSQSFAMFVGF